MPFTLTSDKIRNVSRRIRRFLRSNWRLIPGGLRGSIRSCDQSLHRSIGMQRTAHRLLRSHDPNLRKYIDLQVLCIKYYALGIVVKVSSIEFINVTDNANDVVISIKIALD